MCGIAGFLSSQPAGFQRPVLTRMCDRLRHRGPDDAGYFFDDHAALGHRRLSIIDLGGGHQPLGNEDGSVQIVFNGEIYNYLELRRGLEARHDFRTSSDTEVMVHLYEEVGERLPEYLNGMFAIAIWDARTSQLFLARDRFGKKPLYYTTALAGLRFAFASELKAFTALEGFDRPVNAQSVADFLALSYIPDPQTIYEDVHKLRPGHSLTVTLEPEGIRERRYWAPRFDPSPSPTRLDDTVEELGALAADAVRLRMISDVPLGAFLSGGVDSGAAVALMAQASSVPVRTFSIGFTDKKFDELEYARLLARRYATDHHEQVVSPDIHEMLDKLVEHYDEPFADSSAIPMLYLSRMTRRHVTVALCGDGADELFGGYRRYRYSLIEARVRALFPQWFRRTVFGFAGRWYPKFDYLPQVFRAKMLFTTLAQEIGDSYFTTMSTFRDGALEQVLSPSLRRLLAGSSPRERFRARFAAVSHLGPLEQIQAVDLETYLPGDILVKADRATMAYSLEGRAPWLDYRIGELAFRLPTGFKVRGRIGKYIFKHMAAPHVPEPVITRAKMGFQVPLAQWFRTSLRPTFQQMVLRPEMEAYLSLGEVRRLWGEHQSGRHNHDRKLWSLLMLACWDATHRSRTAPSDAILEAADRR